MSTYELASTGFPLMNNNVSSTRPIARPKKCPSHRWTEPEQVKPPSNSPHLSSLLSGARGYLKL